MKKLRVRARDGHVCDSYEEAAVDDFLYQNGIEHKKVLRRWALSQYFYRNSYSYPDWIIHGEFVEYLGLAGVPGYDNGARPGKSYHFLLPYKKVFGSNCQIIHVSKKGMATIHLTDFRTYLLKRFRKYANESIYSYIE